MRVIYGCGSLVDPSLGGYSGVVFHPVTWNLLLVAVPDIAQAMQVPTATWMSVMSQSSTNTAIVIWCIAAAVYERSHTQ